MNDKESLMNYIVREIDQYQTRLCVYKNWHISCQNEDEKIVLKKMISSVEDQVEILYKQFNKIFPRGFKSLMGSRSEI